MLAYTRGGIGAKWFPLGMNGGIVIIDTDVKAKILKPTPFLGGNLGIANISTKDYNASSFDLTLRFGVEVPLTSSLLLNLQYLRSQSLLSSTKDSEKEVNYSGNSFLVGILLSNFGQ